MTDRARVAILRAALGEITSEARLCEPDEALDPTWLVDVGTQALLDAGFPEDSPVQPD